MDKKPIKSPEAMLRQSLSFAMAYDASPATLERLCADAGMTPERALQILDAFNKSFDAAVRFAGRYDAVAYPGYVTNMHSRRSYFNVSHNEPSHRFDRSLHPEPRADDPKPPQTTTCGQCHTSCTHWPAWESIIAGWPNTGEEKKT